MVASSVGALASLSSLSPALRPLWTLVHAAALALGLWLWLGVGIGKGQGWMHAKLLLVIGAVGYHHMCRGVLRSFEQFANKRSHKRFRVFNEVTVLLFAITVVLVVVKPF